MTTTDGKVIKFDPCDWKGMHALMDKMKNSLLNISDTTMMEKGSESRSTKITSLQ